MNRVELQDRLKGALVLAPLTKGGNLPFRRLCVDFGADVTFSEMAYARKLAKGDRKERALLRRHDSEECFGVQIAAKQPAEAIEAAKIIEDSGADFIDINCGCPIDDTTRRGLGAALLRRPKQIAKLVEALTSASTLPITVKIRTGWKNDAINAHEVAALVEESGAAALTVHGRSKQQRYTKAADWNLIKEIAEARKIPVIGNGDILTHYETQHHFKEHSISAVMLARGALTKPWIFEEIKESQARPLSASERIAIYFRFSEYLKQHFGADELGCSRIMRFLPWHLSLFARYTHYRYEDFVPNAETPLIHQRRGETVEPSPVDLLLGLSDECTHEAIARALLSSGDPQLAFEEIERLALQPALAPTYRAKPSSLLAMG
ncbi:MAG: tRNA-dihydrouridine synthase family protein [Bdellovibrionales bacterium]|nr:tRNA-dihydrouridine synthase family protein [Bdellovibrionales bacterium]